MTASMLTGQQLRRSWMRLRSIILSTHRGTGSRCSPPTPRPPAPQLDASSTMSNRFRFAATMVAAKASSLGRYLKVGVRQCE